MERVSAQFAAFAVLVAGLLGLMVVANNTDFDTDVKTAQESRLPGSYTDETSGLTFRMPRGWTAEGADNRITLTAPDDNDPTTSPAAVQVVVERNETEDLEVAIQDYAALQGGGFELPAEEIDTETYGDYDAANVTVDNTETDSTSLIEFVRLNPEYILNVQTISPVANTQWDDVREDLTTIYESVDAANVSLPEPPPPVIALAELPEGWSEQPDSATQITYIAPDQTSFVRFTANPRMVIAQDFFNITEVSDDATPLDLMQEFKTASEATQDFAFAGDPTEIDAMGLRGAEADVELQGRPLNIKLLDAGEDVYVIILTVYADAAAQEALGADAATIVENATFNMPPAGTFDAAAPQ